MERIERICCFLFLIICSANCETTELSESNYFEKFEHINLQDENINSPGIISLKKEISRNTLYTCAGTNMTDEDNPVAVVWNNKVVTVNSSSFSLIEEVKIHCDDDVEATLDAGQFFLYPNGSVFHLSSGFVWHNPEKFCIFHEDSFTWGAKICVKKPKIPICCPLGWVYDLDAMDCVNKDEILAPVISLDFQLIEWIFEDDNVITNDLNCSDFTKPKIVPISNESKFMYSDVVTFSFIKDLNSPPEIYTFPNYCVAADATNSSTYYAKVCVPDRVEEHNIKCKDKVCYRKCCPEGEYFSMNQRGCVGGEENNVWSPTFYTYHQKKKEFLRSSPPNDVKEIHGYPLCEHNFYLSEKNTTTHLLDTGYLMISQDGITQKSFSAVEYCIDHFFHDSPAVQSLLCFKEEEQMCNIPWKNLLITILIIISVCFLLVTLIIYASMKELRVKIHGKILMCYIGSLVVAYITLAVMHLAEDFITMLPCKILGFMLQFSFLAAFCWLNVMSFDIWRTLRLKRPAGQTSRRILLRFLMYCSYAFGVPTIITGVTILMAMQPPSAGLILPDFGEYECFFGSYTVKWVYFYSFITAVIGINFLFYIHVAFILCMASRDTNTILKKTAMEENERVKLYFRLFVVMGLPWAFEIISSTTSDHNCKLWLAVDMFNALQGAFIFFVFLCKRRLIRKITKSNTFRQSRSSKWFTSLQNTASLSLSFRQSHSLVSRNSSGVQTQMSDLNQTLVTAKRQNLVANLSESGGGPPLSTSDRIDSEEIFNKEDP